MTNRELIEILSREDPGAEVMLAVDIEGMLEFRPVGGVRPTNIWLENDTYMLGEAGFKGVILDPDHTVDEYRARMQELAQQSRIREKQDALPQTDPVITELCLDWEMGYGPFFTHHCVDRKGHVGQHTNGTVYWR